MRKATLLTVLLCAVAGCRDTGRQNPPPPPPPEPCGDGIINNAEGEDCEGSDLDGKSCQSLGFDTGALVCGADCKFITTQCIKRCGNGVIDTGESCDGDAGITPCATFGYRSCSAACQLEGVHCVAVPLATAPALGQARGGPGILTDVSPAGAGDLVLAVPSFGRLASFPYSVQTGFASTGRIVSFSRTPVLANAGDLDGDGNVDLAALNDDGSADRFRWNGSGFSFEPLPDAGCAGTKWLGAGEKADGGQRLWALGCTDAGISDAVLRWEPGAPAAASVLSVGGLVAGALADFDRDGRVDAVLVRASELVVLPGSGATASAPVSLPLNVSDVASGDFDQDGDSDLAVVEAGTGQLKLLENLGSAFAVRTNTAMGVPLFLQAADVDLDGRADLVFYEGGSVQVRRASGAFVFLSYAQASGTGPLLSFSVGDVDGDGDPDLVSTHSAGGDATQSFVVINKVR
jgi:FG-GAP-like repeat